MKSSFVYIISNTRRTTFYIGVTADLHARISQHKNREGASFTSRYNLVDLVYYEVFSDIELAIQREKQLKRWHRDWKINLIRSQNPDMVDLYYNL